MRMVQVVDDERLQTYVYNPDSPYTPLARIDQNRTVEGKVGKTQTVYHHQAHDNGQVQSVTDETGDVVWNARYTAHGTLQFAQKTDGKPFDEHLRFAGQYADDETGLHFNTFRYYDPEIGRFVSSDPIGLMGGYNLYRYAPSTTGWIDPWGWCTHGHHSDPKFMGGAAKQKLTDIAADLHRQLHKEMNDFLVTQTKKIGEKLVHMRPQRGNSGAAIRDAFTRSERLSALADFYRTTGSKYTQVVSDFFSQHPGL